MVTEHVTRRRHGVVEMTCHAPSSRRIVVVVVVAVELLLAGYMSDTALQSHHPQRK